MIFACVLCINKCSLIDKVYGNLLKNGLYKLVLLTLHECKQLRMNARMIYKDFFRLVSSINSTIYVGFVF